MKLVKKTRKNTGGAKSNIDALIYPKGLTNSIFAKLETKAPGFVVSKKKNSIIFLFFSKLEKTVKLLSFFYFLTVNDKINILQTITDKSLLVVDKLTTCRRGLENHRDFSVACSSLILSIMDMLAYMLAAGMITGMVYKTVYGLYSSYYSKIGSAVVPEHHDITIVDGDMLSTLVLSFHGERNINELAKKYKSTINNFKRISKNVADGIDSIFDANLLKQIQKELTIVHRSFATMKTETVELVIPFINKINECKSKLTSFHDALSLSSSEIQFRQFLDTIIDVIHSYETLGYSIKKSHLILPTIKEYEES